MSEEQLKAFLEKVKGDTSLQDKLKAAAIHLMLLLIVDKIHAAKALQLTAEDNIKVQSATVELSEIRRFGNRKTVEREEWNLNGKKEVKYRFTDPKTGKQYWIHHCNPSWASKNWCHIEPAIEGWD